MRAPAGRLLSAVLAARFYSRVWALGISLEVLAWLLPWSIAATRFGLGFNEPTAFGGMPRRVWAALVLAWAWLLAMPLWIESGLHTQLWIEAAMVSAPAGAILAISFRAHARFRQRHDIHG